MTTEADRIKAAAAAPKSAAVDGQTVTSHGLRDQVEAAKFAAAASTGAAGSFPLRNFKIKPSGAI